MLNRLIVVFLGAQTAYRWALMMVESRTTSSKSASLANSAKTRCPTRRSDQRAKRLYPLFQGPQSGGRSRHGEPVRAIHRTASTNKRLSLAVAPTSVALPGSIASMRAYGSSRRLLRGISTTPSMKWIGILNLIIKIAWSGYLTALRLRWSDANASSALATEKRADIAEAMSSDSTRKKAGEAPVGLRRSLRASEQGGERERFFDRLRRIAVAI